MQASRTVTPFFQTPPQAGGRRLLLVSFHFPPDTNVGALRWEMMLRSAAKRGWRADVLLMDVSDGNGIDHSRLGNLPPGTRLFGIPLPKQPLIELLRMRQRLLSRARRTASVASDLFGQQARASNPHWRQRVDNLFNDSKRNLLAKSYYRRWRRWASLAARCGIALSRETRYDCVISSGPPHMAHEAARRIARANSIPLITDFRDPWTSDDVAPPSVDGSAWKAMSGRYERLALEASAIIVCNTPSATRFTRTKYPELASKVITVMNGADGEPQRDAARSPRFTITYAGSLYGGRYPQTLFRAVRQVVVSRKLTPADLVVHFIGVEERQREPLVEMATQEGLGYLFTCDTWRPRAEAMALLDSSSILVLLPQVHIHSIPAKLFEYVQRPVWVLVLSDPGTAVAELLQDSGADVVPPEDVGAIADAIGRHYDESRQGVKPQPLNADGRFARERQADLLFREIDRVVRESAPAGAARRAGA